MHPPRLGGAAVGVFACRSPHRPNPIGLTLAKIEKISEDVVQFSGIDLIDGTPVLDLKPYIPDYDQPKIKRRKLVGEADGDRVRGVDGADDESTIGGNGSDGDGVKGYDVMNTDTGGDVAKGVSRDCWAESVEKEKNGTDPIAVDEDEDAAIAASKTAEWLQNANQEASKFNVLFTPVALKGLEAAFQKLRAGKIDGKDFMNDDDEKEDISIGVNDNKIERFDVKDDSKSGNDASHQVDCLSLSSVSQLKSLVENILREDPRSVYRKTKCREMLYFSRVSGLHVTSWFDDDNKAVTVLKIS